MTLAVIASSAVTAAALKRGWIALALFLAVLGYGYDLMRQKDASALQLRSDTENRKDDLGKIGSGVEVRLGEGTVTGTSALHIAGDHQQVSRVTRQWVNRRGLSPCRWGQAVSSACQAAAGRPWCR